MARYTVQNSEGKKVTFEWTSSEPPTDSDMEEVFQAAKSNTTEKPKQSNSSESMVDYPMSYGTGFKRPVTEQDQETAKQFIGGFSAPTRALGTIAEGLGYSGATGGKSGSEAFKDENTGLMRPIRLALEKRMSEQVAGLSDPNRGVLGKGLNIAGLGVDALGYLGASALEDPTTLGAAGVKSLVRGAKGLIKQGAKKSYPVIGGMSERLSGVPLETLEAYSDPIKRQLMKENYGKEIEIGTDLVKGLNDKEKIFGKEIGAISDASKRMPKLSTQSAVDAMESAKSKSPITSRASTEFDISPTGHSGNAKSDPWIDFIRGSKKPENLDNSVSQAKRNFDNAKIDEAVKLSLNKGEDKASKSIVNQSGKDFKALNKKNAELGNRKKHGTDFWWWHDETASEAKVLAKKLRESVSKKYGQLASGEISKADYESALSRAESAKNTLIASEAARDIYNGKSLKEVGSEIFKQHGIAGDDLKDILVKARNRAESVPDNKTILTAEEYLAKRRMLDATIDFSDKADDVVNTIQRAGRTEMMHRLEDAAESSNIPEFKEAMKSYASKSRLIEELEGYIGKSGSTQKARIESFVNNMFGKNSTNKRELVSKFGKIVGTNTISRAKAAQQAHEIGKDGRAAWLPQTTTGLQGSGPAYLGKVAGFALSSPAFASTKTLPALRRLSSLDDKTGGESLQKLLSMLSAYNTVPSERSK